MSASHELLRFDSPARHGKYETRTMLTAVPTLHLVMVKWRVHQTGQTFLSKFDRTFWGVRMIFCAFSVSSMSTFVPSNIKICQAVMRLRVRTKNFLDQRARFTINFCPANMKNCFYKELQNITMVTKYNLFTVNKWIFTTLKSIMCKQTWLLARHLCQNSPLFAFLWRFCLHLSKKNQKRHKVLFREWLYR